MAVYHVHEAVETILERCPNASLGTCIQCSVAPTMAMFNVPDNDKATYLRLKREAILAFKQLQELKKK